jgi:hypothetical protein
MPLANHPENVSPLEVDELQDYPEVVAVDVDSLASHLAYCTLGLMYTKEIAEDAGDEFSEEVAEELWNILYKDILKVIIDKAAELAEMADTEESSTGSPEDTI